jgi:aspartate carbamoyltransferase regulatory subunit
MENIYLKDKSNNSPRGFFSVRIKDKVMYVRAAGILDIIELFSGPENTSQWRDLLGDAEWVSLSEEEFASLANLPPGQNIGSIFDFNQQMKQKVTVQNLLDKLIADAFKDYNSGCIANVHGKYTLTLKAADLDSVCSSLIKYCINNSDLIASCLKNYVKGLSAEQLELFGADENMRQQILSAIDGAAADIGTNRDAYLQYWQEINWDEYESVIYGSQIVSSIEKTSTGYKNSTLIHVAANGLDIVLSTRQNTKAVQAIEVEVPNTGVVSYAELESQLPSTLKVEVDYSYYCLEKGFSSSYGDIDVKTVDGSVYLPMRQLAEILGEEIVWDEQTGEAYILKNGQKISMTRTIEADVLLSR